MSQSRGVALTAVVRVFFCALLTSCASDSGIGPEASMVDAATFGAQSAAPYNEWPPQNWWQEFADPVLNDLIAQAMAGSPSLQVAAARLQRAKAIGGLAESALWPQIQASLSTTRERFSEHAEMPPTYAGSVQNINDVQIGAQWTLDFFGQNHEGLRAAIGELRATLAEQQAARVLLASDVARAYYHVARLLAQKTVAEQRHQQQSELAALLARRFQSGIDARVELERAEGAVPESARDIASLDEQIALARHALAALLGKGPNAVDALMPSLPDVSSLPLPQSLPADLLAHRADVVAARWRAESATHQLRSAHALFYPNIDLRAFTGFSATGLDHWLEAGSRQHGIGLAVHLPVFDAGRVRSLYRFSAASVDNSVAAYNAAVLNAARDAADRIATLQALGTQLSRQQAVLASAERSYALATARYRAGIADRLSVLGAETYLLAQRRTAVDLQARWIDSRIELQRALGGGFAEAS